MRSYWASLEGRLHAAFRRSISMVRLRLDIEPRSKRSWRPKFRPALQEGIRTSAEPWLNSPSRDLATWPRPRAALSLDIHAYSSARFSPRIDAICKWLLDELGGPDAGEVIYRDDRQVRWLFAAKVAKAAAPHIDVTAQTVAFRIADIALAEDLEPTWRDDEMSRNPLLASPIEIEHYSDWLEWLNPDRGEFDQSQIDWTQHHLRYQSQAHMLASLDMLLPSLLRQIASKDSRDLSWIFTLLRQNPYAFDLGPIPNTHGDSDLFRKRVRDQLASRAVEQGRLFPLLPMVGLTVLYARTPKGKDLDNLILELLPIVLDELAPPARESAYLTSAQDLEEEEKEGPEVKFVEAVALDNVPNFIAPGSAFLLLSSGWRLQSWWELASNLVDRHPVHDSI